jgi:hypothetical protein
LSSSIATDEEPVGRRVLISRFACFPQVDETPTSKEAFSQHSVFGMGRALERPLPPNLWTVPACVDCNASFKSDDEYTRTVLALDIRANWNVAAQSNLPAIIRSLQRKDARGFAEYLGRQSPASRILTMSGMPMNIISTDKSRVNKTGMHILRGLYFKETGRRLTADFGVRVASKAGLTADHPDMEAIARVFNLLRDHRNGAVGRAFSYAAGFGFGRSVWLMLLYDYYFWMGTIDERPEGEREEDGASGPTRQPRRRGYRKPLNSLGRPAKANPVGGTTVPIWEECFRW